MARLASRLKRLTCSLLWALAAVGCKASLPSVPLGPHPLQGGATPVVVDEAPPAAIIEELYSSAPPERGCLWSDGFYDWQENYWVWRPGNWVRPEPGCYFAEPLLVWAPGVNNGVLFHTPGQWYRDGGRGVCEAPPSCEP